MEALSNWDILDVSGCSAIIQEEMEGMAMLEAAKATAMEAASGCSRGS